MSLRFAPSGTTASTHRPKHPSPDPRLPLIARRATWGTLAKDRKKLTSGIQSADQLAAAG